MQTWHATGAAKALAHKTMASESPLAAIGTQIVDACFAGIIFVAPLFFGGRHALGRLVFISLACTAGVVWFSRQAFLKQARWTRTWSYLLGIAAILLVTIQVVPLPYEWLQQLTPRNLSLLPLWTDGSGTGPEFGEWKTLSLTPSATKVALATLVAYALLFVTAVQRLQTLADIQRLLRAIAVAAVLMSGFGLLQYFTSNGRFFWFYELPFTSTTTEVKGSFSCRNHFAHFVALGFAPLLAWIVAKLRDQPSAGNSQRSSSSLPTIMLHLGMVLVVFALLLSLSRGGAVAIAVASAVCGLFYYSRRMIANSYLYSLAALGLVVIGLLSINGYERVANRLDDFSSGSLEQLDTREGRRKIWASNLAAINQGGLFGAGAGSHREIYPVYLAESLEREYTHAENGYLQIATENGYLGISLLGLTLATLARWCWKALRGVSNQQFILAVAVLASLAASVAHSLVDFVWFIPACMSLAILLAASALRLAQLSQSETEQARIQVTWTTPRWIGLAAAAALASLWAVSTVMGPAAASTHWDKYLLSATAKRHQTVRLLRRHQPDLEAEQQQRSLTETMIFHLQQVLARDPKSARAHLRLAGKYLQLFDARQQHADNAMSIDQIRDAANASQFASADELRKWLLQAFGENSKLLYLAHYHTRQALQLCPMQGEGYLYLANLCFLQGQRREAIDAYIAQSMLVRPHDGQVLFEAGRQLMLLGQSEQAINLWQRIFHDAGIHQIQIVRLLAGRFPAALFLETFKPDWQTLPFVWQRYRKLGNPDDWQKLVQYATQTATHEGSQCDPRRAARLWRSLASMQRQLENTDQALASLQHAYEIAPSDYAVRRELGQALLRNEQYRQAEPHLRWCLARKPNDATLRNELVLATKKNQTQTANAKRTHIQ